MEQSSEVVADLLLKITDGNRAAFASLYSLTRPKLFRIALLILANPADAEDALQEIYIKVWRRSGSYTRGELSPISWLAAIARNQSIDMLRARAPTADDILEMTDLCDVRPSPEEACLQTNRRRQVGQLIDELDPKTGVLLRSAYIDGLSYIELADTHRTPINTVRTRLRRGLSALRGAGVLVS